MPFFGSFDVYSASGRKEGSLEVTREGLYALFSCRASLTGEPVRLWISSGDQRLSLGVPVPDGEGLSLKKRLALSSLRLREIDRAELLPVHREPAAVSKEPRAAAPEPHKKRIYVHIGGKIVEIGEK